MMAPEDDCQLGEGQCGKRGVLLTGDFEPYCRYIAAFGSAGCILLQYGCFIKFMVRGVD